MRSAQRGRTLFRGNKCTNYHNVDQSKRVLPFAVPKTMIVPGDNPVTLLVMREPPLNPILDRRPDVQHDKAAAANASVRGDTRGSVTSLLLDLERKPNFLHNNSVPPLDRLLDPSCGATAPHPFHPSDKSQRADLAEFLRGLSATER